MRPDEVVGPPIPHVVESEIDRCVALFHPDSAEVVVLNATASDVWRLGDGRNTLEELVAILARAYGVDPESITDDVVAAVSTLDRHGFFLNG